MRTGFARVALFAVAGLLTAPAFAQSPVFDWSGFYGGVQGGFGQSTATHTGTLDYMGSGYDWGNPYNWRNQPHSWSKSVSSSSEATPEFGAFAGYNFQLPNGLVFGGEADINWADTRTTGPDKLKIIPYHCHSFCVGAYDLTTSTDWYGTVRGRVGQAIGQLLIYGTGGLAYGDVSSSGSVWGKAKVYGYYPVGFNEDFTDSGTRFGWAAGGGAELAINERVSVKLEYLHIDLGEKEIYSKTISDIPLVHCDPGTSDLTGTLKNKIAIDTVRLGVALHF